MKRDYSLVLPPDVGHEKAGAERLSITSKPTRRAQRHWVPAFAGTTKGVICLLDSLG
jgi:hypothetical protein